MREQGVKVDSVSLGEIERARRRVTIRKRTLMILFLRQMLRSGDA